ncbi:uncharacterized oxidoreductase At4g09670-like [Vigna unguiculata]|uniref:uncharacterized oxidoreductase At4g09670-like n=1 Tax=Vigna unguiculata TaxID=3917 RepID=UPI001016A26A|nr:uncharacterized oxidoreductase At4g09670-like [Vigna unguiculata]
MAETPKIRFGFIGCAGIGRRVSRAVALAPNAVLNAVGSRSLDKARAFAAANGFPAGAKVYGSYEAVLDDPEVDVVYLPLPTSLHVRWAVLAASKKKHVLLEKPVALNVAEFDEIIAACESNGVQLMDGTMWMHHPRTSTMKEFLSDVNRFGQLRSIHSNFTFRANADFLENDIRVKPDLDALGALGDAGWYCLRAILWAANYELPKTVIASRNPEHNQVGVILACGATLYWEDGKAATFYCSFLSNTSTDITALGTKGTLHVHDFVLPYEEKEASFYAATESGVDEGVTKWVPQPSKHVIETEIPQEALMVNELARLVADIKFKNAKPEKKWPTISRKTQLVADAVKASIDRGFEPVQIQE